MNDLDHAKVCDDLKQQLLHLHQLMLDDRMKRLPDEIFFQIGDVLADLEATLRSKHIGE